MFWDPLKIGLQPVCQRMNWCYLGFIYLLFSLKIMNEVKVPSQDLMPLSLFKDSRKYCLGEIEKRPYILERIPPIFMPNTWNSLDIENLVAKNPYRITSRVFQTIPRPSVEPLESMVVVSFPFHILSIRVLKLSSVYLVSWMNKTDGLSPSIFLLRMRLFQIPLQPLMFQEQSFIENILREWWTLPI